MGNIFFDLATQHCCVARLESVVGRITTHLKHCHATTFCCCKLKKFVEKSRCQFKLLQHAASLLGDNVRG